MTDTNHHPWPDDPAVRDSVACCRHVTRAKARNFYYGLRLTPEPKRSALYVVYAFMRACDDLADDPAPSPSHSHSHSHSPDNGHQATDAAQRNIDAFKARLEHALGDQPFDPDPPPGTTIWPAVRHLIRNWPVDPTQFWQAIQGQQRDLTQHRYADFDDLYSYCCQVAATVGQVCIAVWGYRGGEDTRRLAEQRGVALQLTNILRDLPEDADRDRLYLPTHDVARFGYDADTLLADIRLRRPGERFNDLIRDQAARARRYYDAAADLESRIEPDCRATSWVMARIYDRLLKKIEKNPRIMLRERVRLAAPTKLALGVRAMRLAPAGRT